MIPERGVFLTAFLTWTVVSVAVAGPVAAQQGTIAGTVSDAGTGQVLPSVQVSVSNLFDTDYRNFVGVLTIGRMALLQLKYVF